jgi:hypothetical protein
MADKGTRWAGVRWIIIAVALAVMFGPSLVVISWANPLQAKAATSPVVNDQSPEDSTTDRAVMDDTSTLTGKALSPGPEDGADPAATLPSNVLWEASPNLGTRVFDGLEQAPGTVTVTDDPQGRFGPSFQFTTWDNADGQKEHCESQGLRRPDGSVVNLGTAQQGRIFYLGWRALWNPMPTTPGRWVSLFQLHVSGVTDGGLNVGPLVLRTLGDGRLYLQDISPNGMDRHIWSAPMPQNTWSSFAIGFRLSRDDSDGWVEFWYNGVQQKLSNGANRYPGATLWGTHVNPKFGVYRSGANNGQAVAFVNHARLGTTYASVAP